MAPLRLPDTGTVVVVHVDVVLETRTSQFIAIQTPCSLPHLVINIMPNSTDQLPSPNSLEVLDGSVQDVESASK